ncbi:MAG: Rrf2 family transcriptional regulator [Chloroflexi bacterium]|nr:Rrf2 family transcriptional regulator [Chloroflexota bacterium]
MQISRRGDYSIRAMIDIASQPAGATALTREIAVRQEIPQAFLVKIISRLTQAGLIRAYRGAAGGVTLAHPPAQINVLQIIEAVEGPVYLNRCLIGPGECSRDVSCSMHIIWKQAQKQLVELFQGTRLSDLAAVNSQADGDAQAAEVAGAGEATAV